MGDGLLMGLLCFEFFFYFFFRFGALGLSSLFVGIDNFEVASGSWFGLSLVDGVEAECF